MMATYHPRGIPVEPSCWLRLTTPYCTISQIGHCVECRACFACFSSARMCQVSQDRRIASHCELDFFRSFPISSSLLSFLVGGTGELPRRSQITCPSPCHGRELHSDRDRGYRRAIIDEEFALPRGRPHWSGSFKFKGPQGGLFPEAPPGESQPAKEFAGLSVWQPHTKVNTQRGKRVLSLGGLFCGASGARPPSLGCFLWGFPFSWHWRCHVVTTL